MRIPKYGKELLALMGLSIAGLLLLACTSQAPLSATATGPAQRAERISEVVKGSDASGPTETEASGAVITRPVGVKPAEEEKAPASVASQLVDEAVIDPALIEGSLPEVAATPQLKHDGAETGIRVSGRGQAKDMPDLATLNLGVETFAGTVKAARAEGAEAMTAVLETLAANGVADKNIQTSHFYISPRYTSREVTRCIETGPDNKDLGENPCFQEWERFRTGYAVTNTVTVRVHELESINQIIDDATDAGGNLIQFQGISFSLEDTKELQKEARAAAVADLMERASQLAKLSKVELGALVYLTETSYAPPARADVYMARSEAAYSSPGPMTPISSGEISVEVSVTGIFGLKPLVSELAGN